MISSQEVMTPLLEMGLNKYESRVYLTLIEEGTSTAKNISDVTSIPYGKVYEIINSLASKGFVLVLPSKPMKYQAIDPQEAIDIIKKNADKKFKNLEKQIVETLVPMFTESRKFLDSKSMFWVLNGRSNMNKKIEDLLGRAEKSINILTSRNGLKRLIIFKEFLEAANKKNISINIAGPVYNDTLEDINSLKFCNIKHLEGFTSHLISVDNKECLLIEPVPDDDNIVYGRDIGIWLCASPFVELLDNSFSTNFGKGKLFEKRLKELKQMKK